MQQRVFKRKTSKHDRHANKRMEKIVQKENNVDFAKRAEDALQLSKELTADELAKAGTRQQNMHFLFALPIETERTNDVPNATALTY